jgi:hypothetical protein
MSDGPIYTGWLPLQLSGDLEKARTFERDGRRLLGAMLAVHGVNERIANGEPGGFFRKSVEMPDGTRLTAITNNGQHMVRIDTPRPLEQREVPHEHHHAEGHSAHASVHQDIEPLEPSDHVPLPTLPKRKYEEEEEEKKKDSSDYMWIGVRSTNPNVPWYSMQAMLVEPDSGPTWDGEHPKRGIVTSVDFWNGSWLKALDNGDGSYTIEQIATPDHIQGNTIDDSIQATIDTWSSGTGAMEHMIPGTHNIEVNIGEDFADGMVLVSANGVRCYCTTNTVQGQTDITKWLPFDPTADDQTGAGVRDYGDRKISGSYPIAPCLWDVNFVLDPDEDTQQYPCDTRPHALALRQALEQVGMTNQVLPGQYMLALHVYDNYPQLRSTRIGEAIPLYPGSVRNGETDYIEFMHPADTTLNTGVYIEVRLGRGDSYSVFKFETVVASCDDRFDVNLPYGFEEYDECTRTGGPQPFGPNFAQQLVAVDVLGGSAHWVDLEGADLAPIFGGGHYAYPDDMRRPLDIYIFYDPLSQPGQENYAEWAAYALYAVLEAATSGVYGRSVMADPGGETGLQGVFSGASQSVIWKYDAEHKTITAVPDISDPDDYPYDPQPDGHGGTFPSPYLREMAWYYPYKYIAKDACRNSLGITLTATKTSFFFENGQVVYFADPPPPDYCC